MRWSKLKQLCEARMADRLAGRVDLHATGYTGAHDEQGRGWITVDRVEVASFCDLATNMRHRHLARADPAATYDTLCARLHAEGTYSRGEFYSILRRSLHLSIDAMLTDDNVLLRALAMTDRRLGKRRLHRLQPEMAAEHPLVQRLYALRCDVERITPAPAIASHAASLPDSS